MNRTRLAPAVVLLLLGAFLGSALAETHGDLVPSGPRDPNRRSPGSKRLEKLKAGPLDWKVPQVGKEVERRVLPSGTIAFLMEDHALPIVNVQLRVRTGSIYEPSNGVAQLTGILLRQGGTASRSPEEVDRDLEYRSISIFSSISEEQATVSLDCLTKDLDAGLDLLADIVMHPVFRQDRVDFQKGQLLEQIRRRNDNPGAISGRLFNRTLYGEHAYGKSLEWQPLVAISRDDLE